MYFDKGLADLLLLRKEKNRICNFMFTVVLHFGKTTQLKR